MPHLPGHPAVPGSLPPIPGRRVPSSPESSHSNVRAGHTWAWGLGVGAGLRPWWARVFGPASPSTGHLSWARKQRNRFQGNFLSSVISRGPSPVIAGRELGWAGPRILGKCRPLWSPREIQEAVLESWNGGGSHMRLSVWSKDWADGVPGRTNKSVEMRKEGVWCLSG